MPSVFTPMRSLRAFCMRKSSRSWSGFSMGRAYKSRSVESQKVILRFGFDWLNYGMAVEIPVAQMSVEEKLRAMELLWENLRQDERDVPVPQWHKDLLD